MIRRFVEHALKHFSANSAFALVAVLLLVAAISASVPVSGKFVSFEVQFTDASAGGFSIVPASCPSDPHFPGPNNECTGYWSPLCSISVSPSSVTSGQNAALSWSASGDWTHPAGYQAGAYRIQSYSIDQGIGTVPRSGLRTVSTNQTVTYTLTINYEGYHAGPPSAYWAPDSKSCSATATLIGPSCPVGYVAQGQTCVFSACPDGYRQEGNQCVAVSCPLGYIYKASQNACVFVACPVGYQQQGNQCVFVACPVGYQQQGNQCIIACPPGYQFQGGQCVLGSCPLSCSGKNVVSSCNEQVVQTCSYQCSAGACVTPPPPTGTLTAQPALVRHGNTSTVRWVVSNVGQCSVSAPNGDSWTSNGDGTFTQTTRGLETETTYALSCHGIDGSTLTRSVKISIVPMFQEK